MESGYNVKYQLALLLGLSVLVLLGLLVGHRSLSLLQLADVLQGEGTILQQVALWELRLPRTLLALLVGAGLASAGTIMQGATANPLASPALTGVVAGAALAIVATISFWAVDAYWLPAIGLLGGLLAGALTLSLAWQRGIEAARVVLAGIAVSALCSSLTSAVLLFSGAEAGELFFWLAGGLSGRGWAQVQQVWLWVLVPLILSWVFIKRFQLLMLTDEVTRSLGFRAARWRMLYLVLAVLMSASVVSVAGPVAFIGLVVPHIARILLGGIHPLWLPYSALLGAGLMLLADLLARLLAFPQEVPVGVITALIGGPWLLYRLQRSLL